jgi:hypothetical protein
VNDSRPLSVSCNASWTRTSVHCIECSVQTDGSIDRLHQADIPNPSIPAIIVLSQPLTTIPPPLIPNRTPKLRVPCKLLLHSCNHIPFKGHLFKVPAVTSRPAFAFQTGKSSTVPLHSDQFLAYSAYPVAEAC